MNIEDYYKAVKALKPSADLDLSAEVVWFETKVTELRSELSKDDLLIVLKTDKQWQAKVDSSVN